MTAPRASAPRLIGANIVCDAFGTAVFFAGIGFFALVWVDTTPSRVLSVLTVGGVIGVALSYAAASWADTLGARPLLVALQVGQVGIYALMATTRDDGAFLTLCSAGAAVSRIASPVRGALPPLYIAKDQIVKFKASVKVWTMVAAVVGAAVAAGLGVVGTAAALLMIPLLNAVSYAAALLLTISLSSARPSAGRGSRRFGLYRPSAAVTSGAAAFLVLFALGYVPETAVSVLAAHDADIPDWVVGATPALALLAALTGQRLLRGRADQLGERTLSIASAAVVAEAASICLLGVVAHGPGRPAPVTVLFVVLGSALAEVALLGVLYLLWDVQYSIGDDADRGGVIGVFTAGTSIGTTVSPTLAACLYFQSGTVAVISSAALILVAVLALAALHACRDQRSPTPATAR